MLQRDAQWSHRLRHPCETLGEGRRRRRWDASVQQAVARIGIGLVQTIKKDSQPAGAARGARGIVEESRAPAVSERDAGPNSDDGDWLTS